MLKNRSLHCNMDIMILLQYQVILYKEIKVTNAITPDLRTRSQYCQVPYPDLSQQLSNASGQNAPSAAFVL